VRVAAEVLPFRVRRAARNDLLALSSLVEEAFASRAPTFLTAGRSQLATLTTTARIALDMEKRMTPWDWSRHTQLVAESSTGRIVGFAELWGEDAAALHNMSALTPQPVLFNLCVAKEARCQGIAQALLEQCEDQCRSWGDDSLYLKVRADNDAAYTLYRREGWELVETRAAVPLPEWQSRWKGSALPLRLMRKTVDPPTRRPSEAVPAKGFDEFAVTLESVLAYKDRDAVVWFLLLIVRNAGMLPSSYRVVPTAIVLGLWGSWILIIKLSTTPDFQDFYAALQQ